MYKNWHLFIRLIWLVLGLIFFLHAFNLLTFLNFEDIRNFFGISFEFYVNQLSFLYLLFYVIAFLASVGLGFIVFFIILPGWFFVWGDKLKEKLGEKSLIIKFLKSPLLIVAKSRFFENTFNLIANLTDSVLPGLGNFSQRVFSGFVKFSLAAILSLVWSVFMDIVLKTQFISYYLICSESIFLVAGFLCLVYGFLPGQFLFSQDGKVEYKIKV